MTQTGYTFYRSLKTLSISTVAGLGTVNLLNVLTILFSVVIFIKPNSTINLGGTNFQTWLLAISLVGVLKLPTYIFTVVIFLVWLNRAYKNLPALRAESTEFTPGWAVGWWFIPFANLVKPYQVVRELWNESEPEIESNGFFSSSFGAPGIIKLWWAFWIISNISANITSRMVNANDANSLAVAPYIFIVAALPSIVAGMLAIKIVLDITERQEERFRNLGSLQSNFQLPPEPPKFNQF